MTRSPARKPPKVTVEEVDVAALKPAAYNPRRIGAANLAALSASVETFGLVQPIVWNRTTGTVVGGHQRLEVLRARGVSRTSVVVVELDRDRERALNLALNNQRIEGRWTPDVLGLLGSIAETLPDLARALRVPELLKSLEDVRAGDDVPEGAAGAELTEALADQVEFLTCPKCKHTWPA